MDHRTVKREKEEFAGEMLKYFQPVHEVVKEKPFELCVDEEPILEPIPSQSVLHVESTQVQTGLDSGRNEMGTKPRQSVLHPEGRGVRHGPASGTAEMETKAPQSVLHVETTRFQPGSDCRTTETEDDEEFWPLSGKPFFTVFLGKSHLNRRPLSIPAKMVRELPAPPVPVVLKYCGKSWNMVYLGDLRHRRLDPEGWSAFALDNNLKVGYACFFELSESSQTKITFRVQILKTDGLPFQHDDEEGKTPETPIIIELQPAG